MEDKRLKREIQDLKITVRIGHNGIKESVITEIIDQLNSRGLIKIKANKGVLDASSRKIFWTDLAKKTESKLVNQIGNVAVFMKK
ncbi:MAG: Uncharacterised protein [Methanobacteriota archaeon]|nr:MAG: Uncharacterised protein [Euryarchaeota archaeon]